MLVKTFEIRDSGTTIPVMAINLQTDNEADRFIIARGRFGKTAEQHQSYVYLIHLMDQRCSYDEFTWGTGGSGDGTLQEAHRYIIKHFFELESGEVIDVEYILGINSTKKVSERFYEHQGLV
jgi:hypothetical protein